MSKKIRKGDVVLAKDLTEDYWGSEIEFYQIPGIKSTMVLKEHRTVYENTVIDLFPEGNVDGSFTSVLAGTDVTILTPPWGHHPEQPTEMGTIIQIEGQPVYTYVVDYYGDILSLVGAHHIPWETVKNRADDKGAKILVHKPTASYDDGLTDIETRDDWDPSKEELYRTRQWEDVAGYVWSFRDGAWCYTYQTAGRWIELKVAVPWDYTPLRLVPKGDEVFLGSTPHGL